MERPAAVTFVGWLFIAAGSVGFVYHASKLAAGTPLELEAAWVLVLRLLAILAGVFLLRGADWARWLALAWMAYHVVLSAFHSFAEAATHAALLLGIAYLLLRPAAAAYFRGRLASG